MADNPFQLVYKALWSLVERNTTLTDLVSIGNREKYDDWVGGKRSISEADLPELALLSEGGLSNLQSSSSHSEITRSYMWALTTGDLNIDNYNNISFELFRAMVDWDRFICGIEWEYSSGEFVQVVQRCELLNLEEGTFIRNEQNRGIRGWAAMWGVDVLFMIPTETLRIP